MNKIGESAFEMLFCLSLLLIISLKEFKFCSVSIFKIQSIIHYKNKEYLLFKDLEALNNEYIFLKSC